MLVAIALAVRGKLALLATSDASEVEVFKSTTIRISIQSDSDVQRLSFVAA
jgi:hypothetical protein